MNAGFDRLGVARAERLDRDASALDAWLAAGRHGSMAWLQRNPGRRADPRKLLPGCESVVVLLSNYDPGPEAGPPPPGHGRVARYARGRDYHKVLGRALKHLASWLEQATGETTRAFVDTAPLLERAWAERAGLGWIGKNANLITQDLGSWVLIGEILTAATIEADPGPHADRCGSCSACLDACPTGAIVEPGVVDSRLCISYWTIEHRGAIPPTARAGNGSWIFGCDVCQEVCPWNRTFARPVDPERFSRRDELAAPAAAGILELDERAFRARYSGTSLMRARWDGMRRNACIVLGNLRRDEAMPSLSRALGDDDAMIRRHAAWALGRIGGARAAGALSAAAAKERSPDVAAEIDRATKAAAGVDPDRDEVS